MLPKYFKYPFHSVEKKETLTSPLLAFIWMIFHLSSSKRDCKNGNSALNTFTVAFTLPE